MENIETYASLLETAEAALKRLVVRLDLSKLNQDELESLRKGAHSIHLYGDILNEKLHPRVQDDTCEDFAANVPSAIHAPSANENQTGKRHRRDVGFDYLLLCAHTLSNDARPIGLDTLHKLAKAYDSTRKPASTTTKLQRWKEEKLLNWIDSPDRKITEEGRILLRKISRQVKEETKARVALIIRDVIGGEISPL